MQRCASVVELMALLAMDACISWSISDQHVSSAKTQDNAVTNFPHLIFSLKAEVLPKTYALVFCGFKF